MRLAGFKIGVLPLNIFKNTIAIVGFFSVVLLTSTPLLPDLSSTEWATLFLSGFLGVTLADVLFIASLNRLGASLQAIVDCVYAPSVIVVAFLLFSETVTEWEIIGGTLVGFAVLVGASSATEVKSKRDLVLGLSFGALAHVLMAFGALIARDIYREHSVVWVCGVRFLFANVVLILWGLRYYKGNMWAGFQDRSTWKLTVPSAVMGSFLATIFWLSGFKYTVAGRVAIYNQMSSVFILILGILILKEQLTVRKVLGISLGIAGGLVISFKESLLTLF